MNGAFNIFSCTPDDLLFHSLLTVVDLPFTNMGGGGSPAEWSDYKGIVLDNVELVRAYEQTDTLFGSATCETWESLRADKKMLIGDLVKLVMERFQIKFVATTLISLKTMGPVRVVYNCIFASILLQVPCRKKSEAQC